MYDQYTYLRTTVLQDIRATTPNSLKPIQQEYHKALKPQ